jgi:hypothetical protein
MYEFLIVLAEKALEKGVDTAALALEIEEIYATISQVYEDVSDAHFESACMALRASKGSKAPELEIRSAVGHLRDAYNVLKKQQERPQRKSLGTFLLEKIYGDDETVGLAMNHCEAAVRIATAQYLLYVALAEEPNMRYWRTIAIGDLERYFRVYRPNAAELYSIDRRFAEAHSYTVADSPTAWGIWAAPQKTYTDYTVTEAGRAYVEAEKKRSRIAFARALDTATTTSSKPPKGGGR